MRIKPRPAERRVMNILRGGGRIEFLGRPLFRPCAQVIGADRVVDSICFASLFRKLKRYRWIEPAEGETYRISAAGLKALRSEAPAA